MSIRRNNPRIQSPNFQNFHKSFLPRINLLLLQINSRESLNFTTFVAFQYSSANAKGEGGGKRGVEWQMGSVSLRYPVTRSNPTLSLTSQVRQRINHPHLPPPLPLLYLSFRVNRGRTHPCHPSSRVSPSEGREREEERFPDRPFYPSVPGGGHVSAIAAARKRGNFKPGLERCVAQVFSIFFFFFFFSSG